MFVPRFPLLRNLFLCLNESRSISAPYSRSWREGARERRMPITHRTHSDRQVLVVPSKKVLKDGIDSESPSKTSEQQGLDLAAR